MNNENPWGILESLEDGRKWLYRLEGELTEMMLDLVILEEQLTESSKNALEYSIVKTKEAIEIITIEMKMFKE